MGREIRMVPPDWRHPKNAHRYFIPLFPGTDVGKLQAEWDVENKLWASGDHEMQAAYYPTGDWPSFEQWDGGRPEPRDYMPNWPEAERTHYQLYETTTEGTPEGPVFASFDELCAWAEKNATTFADFRASKEQWAKMLKSGLVTHREGNFVFC